MLSEYTIIELLLANPGIYLDELQQELYHSTGTWASISTIFRTIYRLDFTRKTCCTTTMRTEFMEEMSYIGTNMIVWLDETGSDRRNARRYGYHLRGMTPTNFRLTVHGKRLSSIGIMLTLKMWAEASMLTHFVILYKDVWFLSYNHLMVQMIDL